MKIEKPDNLSVAFYNVVLEKGKLHAAFIVKAHVKLKPGETSSLIEEEPETGPAGDAYVDDNPALGLHYPSDFVPRKPRADIFVVGAVHSPGKQPVASLDVSLRVGKLRKTIRAIGDRTAESRILGGPKLSAPATFTTMLLSYTRAYGGPVSPKNPIGRGLEAGPMANFEYPDKPTTGPKGGFDPAGLGPIERSWAPRKSMTGTFGADYMKKHWPAFPPDFDESFFNAAPRDQQIEGHLRGDEEVELTHLHPAHAAYKTCLPAVRVRLFLHEKLADGHMRWHELPLTIDTLWIDMTSESAVMLWRGLTQTRTMKLREIEDVYVAVERMADSPKPADQHKADMIAMREARSGDKEDAAEEAARAKRQAEFDKEMAAADQVFAGAEADLAKAEAQVMAEVAKQEAHSVAMGAALPQMHAVSDPAKDQAAMIARLTDLLKNPSQVDPRELPHLQELLHDLQSGPTLEAEAAAFAAEADADFASQEPLTREHVVAAVAKQESLAGVRLDGLDLSKLDLTGINLTDAKLRKTNLSETKLVGAGLAEADLDGADLSKADLTGANLNAADLTRAKLVGATFTDVTLDETVLVEIEAAGLTWTRCRGSATDFTKAKLAGAKFIEASLPQAAFVESDLTNAVLQAAELKGARFDNAKATDINLEGANLTGAQSEAADFSRGRFRKIRAAGSSWEDALLDGADFSGAQLSGAMFPGASLRKAKLYRAELSRTVFEECDLEEAQVTESNLLRASFDRANLTAASFQDSNLYEAGFWDAVLEKTNFRAANVKGTALRE